MLTYVASIPLSTRAGTRSLTSARQVLQEAGLPLLAPQVPQREAIAAAWGTRRNPPLQEIYTEIWGVLQVALVEVGDERAVGQDAASIGR